jgi:hypothetical protein
VTTKRDIDRRALDGVLAKIRTAFPAATRAMFETSDQQAGHGFRLLCVWAGETPIGGVAPGRADSKGGYTFDVLYDDVTYDLADICWDGVMDENRNGYAITDLP